MKRLPLFGSIGQIEEFLKTNQECGVKFEITSAKYKYELINQTLWEVGYRRLARGDKHTVFRYLKYLTGYSQSHIKRLANKWRKGTLVYNPARQRNKFAVKYFPSDIALLIKTDMAHGCLNGQATKEILEREHKVFKHAEYANISRISVAHIYNIRNRNRQYASSGALYLQKTKRTETDIGIRRKPRPGGRPGYLRVDTVHQGDQAGNKGVYHINIVDEITQYELVATVEKITEQCLRPVIEELLELFPFRIFEFHADNGSEYINRWVAGLLNKLHILLTKSRSRHSNDNALVESKNGSCIRKVYGRNYIAAKWARELNDFNRQYLNIYLNYHRPCAFAKSIRDKRGKERKSYPDDLTQTPYDRLRSLPNASQYLKDGFTFAELDKIAYAESDNQFAERMGAARERLFRRIAKDTSEKNSRRDKGSENQQGS